MLSFSDFYQLCREQQATLVPLSKAVPADLLTPVSAFLSIAAKEKHAFLLESVEGGERLGRYTFLGARPYLRVVCQGGKVQVSGRAPKALSLAPQGLLSTLKALLSVHRPAQVAGLPPFTGGAVGYIGYDFVRELERIPERARDELHLPECSLMFFDRVLAFDHVKHQIQIIATVDVSGCTTRPDFQRQYARAVKDIASLEQRLTRGPGRRAHAKKASAPAPLKMQAVTGRKKFLADVERAKEYIRAGDIFQVVLSQRFDFPAPSDPFGVYRALRTVNPSPYMYYLRMEDICVAGSSPEMLLRVHGQRLEYRPIAGTRPRGRDAAEDTSIEAELMADEKERAEHVMLVDLGRNDLGRVSEYGSVKVRDLMFVERYSHVMHIVSALEGTLRKELSALDAFAACFPAGTLSGAPKVRAMQIIEEMEPVRRGIYGGSVLYADFAGNLDSCIAIRTLVMKGKKASVQAGAGIVADSVPEREYEECVNKAKAVVRAVEISRGSKDY